MEKRTFLFYDLETSGLNKCFDQVLQFAAIRTDFDLNELERCELKVRLSPDTFPSPQAMLTHQISLKSLLNSGMSEIEAISHIHKLLNTPGTISLGFNTLDFDDKFLRFAFFRHLLTPYTHQYASNCSRADLYPFIVKLFLYKKEVLNWPIINNKLSFKLEYLNSANNLSASKAHDAMGDVETTVALAKKIFADYETKQYFLRCFDKKSILNTIFNISQQHANIALIVHGIFGSEQNFQTSVFYLGQHHHYKNQHIWLSLDRIDFSNIELTKNIPQFTKCITQKIGEKYLLLPFTDRFTKNLHPEKNHLIQQNKKWLESNSEWLKLIKEYYLNFTYPKIPNIDSCASLYENGFLSYEDEAIAREFHRTQPSQKFKFIKKFSKNYLQELAIRLIGKNYLHYLPEEYQTDYEDYIKNIILLNENEIPTDYLGNKRPTPQEILAEISLLKETKNGKEELIILNELEAYLKAQMEKVCQQKVI